MHPKFKNIRRRRSSHPSRNGFTLVELLVVIAIIAILASVLLVAGGQAIRAAKQAKAANMANQLQTATLSYYTEYSVYPVPSGTTTDYVITDASGSATAWGNLIQALSGNINPINGTAVTPNISNTRAIAFLSLKSSDVDSNDAPLNPLPGPANANIYFNIAMDSDYDGIVGGSSSSTGQLPNFSAATMGTAPPMTGTATAGVAVWANCNSTYKKNNPNWWVHTY